MEITEKERLLLVEKKETICGLTLRILAMEDDPNNSVKVKKDITTILSLLSTIASYSNVKEKNLDGFTSWADLIFFRFNLFSQGSDEWRGFIVCGEKGLEEFCNAVNSIRFDFTNKKGIKIVLPKNLNLLSFVTNK